MITCKFTDDGFTVSGHSGYATEGSDIICAAVSAMTMLVCNTITGQLKADADIRTDEKTATVSFRLKSSADKNIKAILNGLRCELEELTKEYPENINVI